MKILDFHENFYFPCRANIIKLLYSESHLKMLNSKVWKKFHKIFKNITKNHHPSHGFEHNTLTFYLKAIKYVKILQIFRFRYCLCEVVAPPILPRFQNFYMFWKATILIRSFLALLISAVLIIIPKTVDEVGRFSSKSICTTLTRGVKDPKIYW